MGPATAQRIAEKPSTQLKCPTQRCHFETQGFLFLGLFKSTYKTLWNFEIYYEDTKGLVFNNDH